MDCAPSAAQAGMLGWVSFDQRFACPFLSRQFLKLGDFGAGLETATFGRKSVKDQKAKGKKVVLMTCVRNRAAGLVILCSSLLRKSS